MERRRFVRVAAAVACAIKRRAGQRRKRQPRRLPRAIRAAALLAQLAFASAQVNRASVLRNLYEVTGGANWSRSDNWLQGDPCSYTAPWASSSRYDCVTQAFVAERQPVCCQQLDGALQVVKLDLADNGLRGTLPTVLGMLTALRLLVLDDNQLSGTLPTEIGKLANLQVLWLQYNQLSGVLPTELANLEKLEPVQSSCLLSPNRFGCVDAMAPPNRACNASALAWTSASGYLPAPGEKGSCYNGTWTDPGAVVVEAEEGGAGGGVGGSTAVTTVVALVVVAISLVVLREVWRRVRNWRRRRALLKKGGVVEDEQEMEMRAQREQLANLTDVNTAEANQLASSASRRTSDNTRAERWGRRGRKETRTSKPTDASLAEPSESVGRARADRTSLQEVSVEVSEPNRAAA